MHPLPCARQYIISSGARIARGLAQGRLQGPDGFVKRQPLSLQHLSSRAFAVANNSGQNNRAIDVAALTATRGCGRSFKNAPQGLRHAQVLALGGRAWPHRAHQKIDGLGFQPENINMAGIENTSSVGIVTKCDQEMFKRDLGGTHGARPIRRPGQRGPKRW